MLADTQTLAMTGWTGTPFTLPRIGATLTSGEFRIDDGTKDLLISHATTKSQRQRDLVKLSVSKIAADPLISDRNLVKSASIGLTFDRPLTGFSVDEIVQAFVGLSTLLTASTNTNLKKVLGLES